MLARMLLDGSQLVSSINLGTMPTPSAGTYWNAIAAGNGVFVAVVAGTASVSEVAVSTDGILWTAYALSASGEWSNVAFLNNKFYLLAYSGTSLESADGITWVNSTAPAGFSGAAYGNGLYVLTQSNLVGSSGNTTATSATGTSWTTNTISTNIGNQCVFAGGKFFSYGIGPASTSIGSATPSVSTDGVTWTGGNSGGVAQGTLAITSTQAAIFQPASEFSETSISAASFASTRLDAAQNQSNLSVFCAGNGYFVAFGKTRLIFSQDVLSWTSLPLPSSASLCASAFNPANRTYCAVGATQSVALTL